MVRIINYCCCDDLHRKTENELLTLGNDITNEITITTNPTILLSTINLNRKLIKIYTANCSNPLGVMWIQHGIDANLNSFGFALPVQKLYENSVQANQPLSVYCSSGIATIRFTVVNIP
jgi:hypothetical protein